MQKVTDQWKSAIPAVLIAVATTTLMDLNGLTLFSAFPLLLISLIFYLINRPGRKSLGFSWGKPKDYGIALLYPVLVGIGTILAALLFTDEVIQLQHRDTLLINLISGILAGSIMVLLTEEGFFRGWLWATLRQAGLNNRSTLLLTTLAFTVWHISAVTSGTSYGLPPAQVPVYLVNVFLLGLIWGYLRAVTNSVLVTSFCHAAWNALIYTLFGFGEKTGALGFEQMHILGPEVGYLGIVLNTLFLLGLIRYYTGVRAE